MRIHLLAAVLLLGSASVSLAQTVQTKSLVSSGGINSSVGSLTMSSNIGDIIIGPASNGSQDVWSGFYTAIPASLLDVEIPLPKLVTYLARVYPNPALLSPVITYGLATIESQVSLAIYDLNGRRVRQLSSGKEVPGVYHTTWDLRSEQGDLVGAGIYFVQLRTSTYVHSARFAIVR